MAASRDPKLREAIADELADVANIVFLLSEHTGIDLSDAVTAKMAKNEIKYPHLRLRPGNGGKPAASGKRGGRRIRGNGSISRWGKPAVRKRYFVLAASALAAGLAALRNGRCAVAGRVRPGQAPATARSTRSELHPANRRREARWRAASRPSSAGPAATNPAAIDQPCGGRRRRRPTRRWSAPAAQHGHAHAADNGEPDVAAAEHDRWNPRLLLRPAYPHCRPEFRPFHPVPRRNRRVRAARGARDSRPATRWNDWRLPAHCRFCPLRPRTAPTTPVRADPVGAAACRTRWPRT